MTDKTYIAIGTSKDYTTQRERALRFSRFEEVPTRESVYLFSKVRVENENGDIETIDALDFANRYKLFSADPLTLESANENEISSIGNLPSILLFRHTGEFDETAEDGTKTLVLEVYAPDQNEVIAQKIADEEHVAGNNLANIAENGRINKSLAHSIHDIGRAAIQGGDPDVAQRALSAVAALARAADVQAASTGYFSDLFNMVKAIVKGIKPYSIVKNELSFITGDNISLNGIETTANRAIAPRVLIFLNSYFTPLGVVRGVDEAEQEANVNKYNARTPRFIKSLENMNAEAIISADGMKVLTYIWGLNADSRFDTIDIFEGDDILPPDADGIIKRINDYIANDANNITGGAISRVDVFGEEESDDSDTATS